METKKKKILVLSDLNDATDVLLKNAIGLASIIHGEIQLFHVKKPTDVVKTDNQFSAMRSMKDEFLDTEKQIKKLIRPTIEAYKVEIEHRFTFGHVKREIQNYLESYKPDVIVMGKRSSNPLNIMGDGITAFVMNAFEGEVLLAGDENAILPNQPISLGFLNGMENGTKEGFAKNILEHSRKPIKAFSIVENKKGSGALPSSSSKDLVEFVFEKDQNSISNLSNYLKKNSINLLCVERDPSSKNQNANILTSDFKNTLGKLQVSLLFTGKQKYSVS